MILVSPLACGYPDAPGGFARIYSRGTSSNATCYTEFDGSVSTTTHALSEMGRVKRYVNEIVDVYVYDATGVLVDSFTFASGAQSTEIIHPHVTGTDYDTGATGLSKPTTLQAMIDKLYTTFGADDFNVVLGGVTATLATTIGTALISGVYNVRGSAYGAVGDGVTNDRTAIQAAITAAAAAGGGTVFLPAGNYRITSQLDMTGSGTEKVNLMGAGSGLTTISSDHATANWLQIGTIALPPGMQTISGITFASLQATTGFNVALNTSLGSKRRFIDCVFGGTNGYIMINQGYEVEITSCRFDMTATTTIGAGAIKLTGGATTSTLMRLTNCTFDGPTGAWNPTNAVINFPSAMVMTSCRFNFPNTTGTGTFVDVSGMTSLSVNLTNNVFHAGAATWTGIAIPLALGAEAAFTENGNSFITCLSYVGATSTNTAGYYQLGSRESRNYDTGVTGNQTIFLNVRDFASATIRYTGGGASACDFRGFSAAQSNPAPGCFFDLIVRNGTSGVVTVTFTSTNITWKYPAIVSPTSGTTSHYRFQYNGGIWSQCGLTVLAA